MTDKHPEAPGAQTKDQETQCCPAPAAEEHQGRLRPNDGSTPSGAISYQHYEVLIGGHAVYFSADLYDAAEYVGAYEREFPFSGACVVDRETGENWTYGELFEGHFMDDLGELRGWVSEQPSIGATMHRRAEEQAQIWRQSSLVKKKYRLRPEGPR